MREKESLKKKKKNPIICLKVKIHPPFPSLPIEAKPLYIPNTKRNRTMKIEENHKENNTEKMEEAQKKQKHIILVHGACHGAWCWYKVAAILRSWGHRVAIPDLAASGIDTRRLEDVSTFLEYSEPLLKMMSSLPEGEKTILVGHSLGGLNIAMAMEHFHDKVEAAIFVAAVLPDCLHHPFYPVQQLFEQHPSTACEFLDTEFKVLETSTKGHIISLSLGPQFLAKIYKQCSCEDLVLASTLVRPASLFQEDLESSPALSKNRYGSVPSFYIICCDDEQISEDHQRWMIENHQVKEVTKIEKAGHMVMLERPNELCQSILHIINATN